MTLKLPSRKSTVAVAALIFTLVRKYGYVVRVVSSQCLRIALFLTVFSSALNQLHHLQRVPRANRIKNTHLDDFYLTDTLSLKLNYVLLMSTSPYFLQHCERLPMIPTRSRLNLLNIPLSFVRVPAMYRAPRHRVLDVLAH